MKKLASALIVMSLFLSGTALAANKPAAHNGTENAKHQKAAKARAKFDDCDKEKVGSLSFDEAKQCFPRITKEKFDAIDANKDGRISKEELKAHRAAKKAGKAAKQ